MASAKYGVTIFSEGTATLSSGRIGPASSAHRVWAEFTPGPRGSPGKSAIGEKGSSKCHFGILVQNHSTI